MEPKVDPHLVTKFIPALMSLIVDDQVRSFNAKLPEEERETASIVIDHSGPPPDAFQVRSLTLLYASLISPAYLIDSCFVSAFLRGEHSCSHIGDALHTADVEKQRQDRHHESARHLGQFCQVASLRRRLFALPHH